MTPDAFVKKWTGAALTERSAAQQHFLDLCAMVDHPAPAAVDPAGEWFTFERGAEKTDGGDGFADVWKRGFFAIEYKGRHKDLGKAYQQILLYREALENPPLLVVCDLDRIVIHTNFTATAKKVHVIPLAELPEARNLEILRNLFHAPDKLRPGATSQTITEEAAARLGGLALSLRGRGLDAAEVARFVDRIVFCLFAEDVALLPDNLFTNLIAKTHADPPRLKKLLDQLFHAMANGGDFGLDSIRHFNGDLFNDAPAMEMLPAEIETVMLASKLDWSAIDPSIFGTLFERGLDPAKRSQLGAHYTSREDIELLIEPVVMAPLRAEWAALQHTIENLLTTGTKSGATRGAAGNARPKKLDTPRLRKAIGEANMIKERFLERLGRVTVLDPACGSGNFLYVTLQKLKNLEKEIALYGGGRGLASDFLPRVAPWQMHGIEINPYAFDLAQMALWIGYLQWTRHNGYGFTDSPLLRKMTTFQNRDAILDLSDPENPKEAGWPKVDFIVGNPPFLGDKLMRRELGDDYVEKLRVCFADRIPGQSDLCCYWFEKARARIDKGKCERAGLLATQGIRGGANREVLKRIKQSGEIFFAVSDREWILDGANVHVSMVGFRSVQSSKGSADISSASKNKAVGTSAPALLDGMPVAEIHANLTSDSDMTSAQPLARNARLGFIGVTKGGDFDLTDDEGIRILRSSGNPNGLPNSDVLKPILNGIDILRRKNFRWLIDNADKSEANACLYEVPFQIIVERVKPARDCNRNNWLRVNWWSLQRIRPELRKSICQLNRFIATPRVSKHRVFSWFTWPMITDDQTVVFARSDDYFFGVLHSRFHEVWSLAQGTQLREKESGFRYTPTTCFETFPFPDPAESQRKAIADAARALDTLRTRWLNPPEWTREEILEFPATPGGPWDRFILPDTSIARYARVVPMDAACAAELKTRTLTNLYNQRPGWLANAHAALDATVADAYGFAADLPAREILTRLLKRNLTAGDQRKE